MALPSLTFNQCVGTVEQIYKEPFSILQTNLVTSYDYCKGIVITTSKYYELNTMFGTMVLLVLVIILMLLGIYIDKKDAKQISKK